METVLKGEGAGGIPTANSVVSDLMHWRNDPTERSNLPRGAYLEAVEGGGPALPAPTAMDELGIVATIGSSVDGINIDHPPAPGGGGLDQFRSDDGPDDAEHDRADPSHHQKACLVPLSLVSIVKEQFELLFFRSYSLDNQ